MKEISSPHHPLVAYWLRLKEKSAFRHAEGRVLLEGRNCIRDVLCKIPAKRLLTTEAASIREFAAEEVILISKQILKKISSVEESDGLIAELAMPPMKPLQGVKVLACDRVQDPGNLGTLIRSALAFGWDSMWLLPGCADPFNDKTLRAAKGATFFLPLARGDWKSLAKASSEHDMPMLVATLHGDPPQKFSKEQKKVLILGNESQGAAPPPDVPCRFVTLPLTGAMESLNVAVAGSILMYLL